jgi:nitrite reductase (NADH) large subunit
VEPRTVVVVGHGMVGHRFVESLRRRDTEGAWRVVVLAEESRPAYDRVALSSYVGEATEDDLALADDEFHADPLVELHLDDPAVAVDRSARRVTTKHGRTVDYDELVLATGSVPFVPPVPGRDLDGVFVYRTLDDLDGLREAAERATAGAGAGRRAGVVVGGGLLGLEAANALRQLGLSPHVVEMAPRLMPVQVDEPGGALLARLVSDLGLRVHTGVSTSTITRDHRGGLTVTLSDDTELDASVVVFSAGIRPADSLAREIGLEVGERGGVLVDERCRTTDEHVWAIGEVAAVRGRTYGLVAPGYAMAEVVAGRLAGDDAASTDGGRGSPRPTCRPSSSCSASTSRASATPTPPPPARSRSASTTRWRAPTRSWSSPTVALKDLGIRHCSAGCWSGTRATTRRCAASWARSSRATRCR